MKDVTTKYFYKEICQITAELKKSGFTDDFIKALKKQNEVLVIETIERYMLEDPELWEHIQTLYREYANTNEDITVFYYDEDGCYQHMTSSENYYKFDIDEIDPLSLACLMALSEDVMNETTLFVDEGDFPKILRLIRYDGIADFLEDPEELNYLGTLESIFKAFAK